MKIRLRKASYQRRKLCVIPSDAVARVALFKQRMARKIKFNHPHPLRHGFMPEARQSPTLLNGPTGADELPDTAKIALFVAHVNGSLLTR
ncbi:hypothetical protein [Franconibacter helveticus]|uniref:hypothetical protein n=1 Tax=Franconibacter helveticus TaxID=357240 RepID=UPI0029144F77|nr:hypothetical protein [Franconibacter helveticus]MDU6924705.1 hypothetical protein [Franconibacter helveticus]